MAHFVMEGYFYELMLTIFFVHFETLRLLRRVGLKESAEVRRDGFRLRLLRDAKIFLLTKSYPNNLMSV